jgi:hypothetical protein
MIDSIRSSDGFGVSKRADRAGPPADEGAPNNYYDTGLLKTSEAPFIEENIKTSVLRFLNFASKNFLCIN